MPSKIASETPLNLPRLAGYWFVSLLIVYALGWAHLSPIDLAAGSPPPPPPAPAAPPR